MFIGDPLKLLSSIGKYYLLWLAFGKSRMRLQIAIGYCEGVDNVLQYYLYLV